MFLTYELDEVDYPTLFNELRDACQFLSPGIMDLTGKVDFLEKQHPGQFMFSSVLSEKAFLAKKKALTAIAAEAPIDQVFDFEVYLGPYHEQYESHLRAAGFKVCDPSRIKLEGEEINSGDLLLVQDPQTPIEGHTVAISSTNAIMRMMK